jgi:hypothetical protein
MINFHARVADDPELVRIWDAAAGDVSSLNEADTARFIWLVATAVFIYEGQYLYYKNGLIVEDAWKPKIDSMLGLLNNPIMHEWWENELGPVSGELRRYVDHDEALLLEGLSLFLGDWRRQCLSP